LLAKKPAIVVYNTDEDSWRRWLADLRENGRRAGYLSSEDQKEYLKQLELPNRAGKSGSSGV